MLNLLTLIDAEMPNGYTDTMDTLVNAYQARIDRWEELMDILSIQNPKLERWSVAWFDGFISGSEREWVENAIKEIKVSNLNCIDKMVALLILGA